MESFSASKTLQKVVVYLKSTGLPASLMQMMGQRKCWLWRPGHRPGKALTPTPARREGCWQRGFAETSVGVLVGAAP